MRAPQPVQPDQRGRRVARAAAQARGRRDALDQASARAPTGCVQPCCQQPRGARDQVGARVDVEAFDATRVRGSSAGSMRRSSARLIGVHQAGQLVIAVWPPADDLQGQIDLGVTAIAARRFYGAS